MTVSAPARRVQIDFHITGGGRTVRHLKDGVAEIRSGFVIPKPGVKNPYRASVQGIQLVALQALVLPDLLEQSFGRSIARGFVQRVGGPRAGSPLRVEIGRKAGHLAIAFRGRLLQSQEHTYARVSALTCSSRARRN